MVALVARQPALLLTDSWTLDFEDVQEQEQQPSSQQRQQQQQQQGQQGLQQGQLGQQQQIPYSSRSRDDASGISGFVDDRDTEVGTWSSSSRRVGQDEDVSNSGSSNSGRGSSDSNSLEQMVAAWEFGLSNDGNAEWEER